MAHDDVVIVDENFSFEMDRALEFCELMIEKQVNVLWTLLSTSIGIPAR
jgi:hypothetical protein